MRCKRCGKRLITKNAIDCGYGSKCFSTLEKEIEKRKQLKGWF